MTISKQCNSLGNTSFLDVAFFGCHTKEYEHNWHIFLSKDVFFNFSILKFAPNLPYVLDKKHFFPSYTWELLQICKAEQLYFLKGKDNAIIQYEPLSLLPTTPPLETVIKVVL